VPRDPVIEQALAARNDIRAPSRELNGRDLVAIEAADQAMSDMLGNSTHVPDLRRAGFRLVSAEIYGQPRSHAVQLRYEDVARRLFTVFLRPSAGPDAFEVTDRGPLRICVWQNSDVTAVMTGEMSTPELFRLASLAYSSLGL
jgi:anti-sigma factor RsiW